jgi:predicted signal transduction protein with EAL and GGDEF domain
VLQSLERYLEQYFTYLERKGMVFNVLVGITCSALIGILDIVAPSHATFSFFYLFPIGFVTWFASCGAGLAISLVCTAFWSTDYYNDISLVSLWNALSTYAIFCSVTLLLSRIKKILERERHFSRKDPLTGILNIRAYSEHLEYELIRLQRENTSFSIAYLDLDNFASPAELMGDYRFGQFPKCMI